MSHGLANHPNGDILSRKISISAEDFEVEATLLEEERPQTCDEIWNSLPFEGNAKFYKEEIFFDIPVEIDPEDATPTTTKGDISYWPEGPAFCIFFGESQPVSPVNTFAKVDKNVENFANIDEGTVIRVRKTE